MKKTALDQDLKGARKSFNPAALLRLLGLIFGALLIAVGVAQSLLLLRYESAIEETEASARQHARTIGEALRNQQRDVAAVAQTEAVLGALREDPSDRASFLQPLIQEHGYERLLLLPSNAGLLDPEPYPGPDYAALAAAILASSTRQVSSPIFSKGRVNWAVPIMTGENVTSLLVVTLSTNPLMTALSEAEAIGGYLDLRRVGARGTDVLVSHGTPVGFGISGTEQVLSAFNLAVGYATAKPFGLVTTSAVMAALPAVLGLLLLGGIVGIGIATSRRKSEEAARAKSSAMVQDAVDEELEDAMRFADDVAAAPAASREQIDGNMFRAYDIRGIVDESLTEDSAAWIGQAIGSAARARDVSEVVVARDGRHSGPELQAALMKGLNAAGVNVIDIGAVPTGVLYFATHHLGTGSGVMVTGSHNPPDYNGFKIMLGGDTLSGDAIFDLRRRIIENDLVKGSGGIQETDVLEDYVDRIASDIQVDEPLRVVVDCGNGIPGMIAPRVLEEIGCEVIPLFCEVDGDFPNHHPDPSVPANLADLITSVKSLGADLGVAFDGDGDRLGVVTRKGAIIYPDRLLMLFAEDVLLRNPGVTVIYDVKCTGHLPRIILEHGGSPLMWKTGHSLMKAKMKETRAALAGEMSGHFFFEERWYGFDCGIYAAARLLEILAAEPDGPDAAFARLPDSHSTPEIKVEMAEGEHYAFLEELSARARFDGARLTTIDGIRADYDDGWGLVRCSNTTPCLVLRFDGETPAALERIKIIFRKQMLAVRKDLDLPF